MKRTIDYYDFVDEFNRYDRADNFSRDGLNQLFNYMEEVNSEYELDVIALCCDFSQCSLREFADAFGLECNDNDLIDTVVGHIEKNGFWYQLLNDDQEVIFENF